MPSKYDALSPERREEKPLERDRERSPAHPAGDWNVVRARSSTPPVADAAYWQTLRQEVKSVVDDAIKPVTAQIASVDAKAGQALERANAAAAQITQLQQQADEAKYDRDNLMQRNKRQVLGPFRLEITAEQLRDPLQRAKVGTAAVTDALSRVVKREPAEHWELFDVRLIELKQGQHRGKYNVVFSVQKAEDAEIIRRHGAQLWSSKQLSLRVWLTDAEVANRKKVYEHQAYKEAVQLVRSKPRGTRGYTMGWDLDRAFTVIASQRTYWSAASIQQAAAPAAAGGAAAPAAAAAAAAGGADGAGAGTSGATAMEH